MFEPVDSTQPWRQRNIVWLILAGLSGMGVLAACMVLFWVLIPSNSVQQSDVYHEALYQARTHPEVILALGEPVRVDGSAEGEVQLEGRSGRAGLTLPLAGSRQEGTLAVVAVKNDGRWEFTRLEVKIEGQAVPINLLSSIRATAIPEPSPTPQPERPEPTPTPWFTPTPEVEPLALKEYSSQSLGLAMPYPASWQIRETEEWVIFYPSSRNSYPDYPADTAIWVGRPTLEPKSEEGLLEDMLAQVTREIEVTGHTSLMVPGHFWSVTEAEFEHQTLGRAQASLSVPMGREDYLIFAIAPASEWRTIQPAIEQVQFDLRYLD